MPSTSDPANLLRALSAGLASYGCRWYLFGAQAVIIWGRPRLTTDVDVTVWLETGSAGEFITALRLAGFQLTGAFSDEFVRTTRVLPLVHASSGMLLDIVLAGPGLEEQFLNRARDVEMDGTVVPVISPEDLVVSKVLAGREKDVEDIRGILRMRAASMDLEYIRTTLAAVEKALGQSDLRPLFENELRRAR